MIKENNGELAAKKGQILASLHTVGKNGVFGKGLKRNGHSGDAMLISGQKGENQLVAFMHLTERGHLGILVSFEDEEVASAHFDPTERKMHIKGFEVERSYIEEEGLHRMENLANALNYYLKKEFGETDEDEGDENDAEYDLEQRHQIYEKAWEYLDSARKGYRLKPETEKVEG